LIFNEIFEAMKKSISIIIKIIAGLALLLIVLLFAIPILFKDKIRVKVEQSINNSVNATVKFDDYSLSLLRHFPNLAFSLNDLSVVGTGPFQTDTLAGIRSFGLVFDLGSIFSKSGYVIKSIDIDKAVFNAKILKDGKANWDIMKEEQATTPSQPVAESAPLKVKLNNVSLSRSKIIYTDLESDFEAVLQDVNLSLSGDMTGGKTDLRIEGKSQAFDFTMEGTKYLKNVVLNTKMDLNADIDSFKFVFRDNFLALNDLKMKFSGSVDMPGDDITTNLSFETYKSSFGDLISLIPPEFLNDYKDISTSGEFQLTGTAKGTYSDKDSTMPDVSLLLNVTNGTMNYPSLPGQVSNINVHSDIFYDGKVTDRSVVKIDKFHLELAGNPFDMTLVLKTPVSDPDFNGSMTGKLDLAALSKTIKMDSMKLAGLIDIKASMAGRMSEIDKQQYEKINASGNIGIKDLSVSMKGYPDVKVPQAEFILTPAYASLSNGMLQIGKSSDFLLNGRVSNYIPYVFRNKTLAGNLTSRSKMIDVTEIMAGLTSSEPAAPDTSSLSVVRIPANIDFDFDAAADHFTYGNIKGDQAKGHIIVHNGILSLKETGMDILAGRVIMNADYDTRDSLKPFMKADLNLTNIEVKESFNTFNTVQSLAPAAKGIDGKVSLKLGFQSLLQKDWMPVLKSIGGEGKLKSDEISLLESETFNKIKETLKLGSNYSNKFKDVNVSFKIAEGRIYVAPFDLKTGNLKMNISGDQGIDKSLNYVVKTEFPRSDLGGSVNSLIDNLSAQAASFGVAFKPADIIKISLKVSGTFTSPVISPLFGASSSQAAPAVVPAATDFAKDKARAEAEKQAAQLLKEADEKGKLIRDEAAKAAESIRAQADAQAKKLTDDNAGKSQFEKLASQKAADALRKGADKKATQLTQEADNQSKHLTEEAKKKGDELLKKI
jgi:hypothetical protein